MNKVQTETYSEKLVLRVNELFHDIANDNYEDIHVEMNGSEYQRWQRISEEFLPHTTPITVLDIGTGQGFVPIAIMPHLNKNDTLICADISQSMLDAARRNIESAHPPCTVRYSKIDSSPPLQLPVPDASVDIITMNSVLHHIKETSAFIDEVSRVLKPNGLLFIAHEPNKAFHEHSIVFLNYLLLRSIFLPKLTITLALKKIGVYRLMRSLLYMIRPERKDKALKIQNTINDILYREGLIQHPIPIEQIADITDIRDAEGFYPRKLFHGYSLRHLDVYNHLLLVSMHYPRNAFVRWYDSLLRKRFPEKGGTFFVVVQKDA